MTKLLFKIIESYLLVHIFNSIQEVKRFSSWFAEMKAITDLLKPLPLTTFLYMGRWRLKFQKFGDNTHLC